jgi:hypothetical protein
VYVECDLETIKIFVNKEEAKAHWGAIDPREILEAFFVQFLLIFGSKLRLQSEYQRL